ncbi:hypothetical protein DM01DRAFT_1384610 [Hesseltinella vesiculosa]|uniref:Zn(2)-C6 fungal-type domain-containing protein n=1 Tax=Hesseltinella vesiculosa TaxID=101127 RepID=A0A1X2GCV7_9FUNG|nr:hypothetical protein DM01DRAFT_1384610 [Hesseltinella vesiculosa]
MTTLFQFASLTGYNVPTQQQHSTLNATAVPVPALPALPIPDPSMLRIPDPNAMAGSYNMAVTQDAYPDSRTKKRTQVKRACVNCQKACKKCGEERPCPRCVRYGLEDSCYNTERKERKKNIKRGPYKKRPKGEGVPGRFKKYLKGTRAWQAAKSSTDREKLFQQDPTATSKQVRAVLQKHGHSMEQASEFLAGVKMNFGADAPRMFAAYMVDHPSPPAHAPSP